MACCLLLACSSATTTQQPLTGVAYVGPATLTLRKDLAPKSAPVGVAKHGEKLNVLETRRRFVKVRSEQGVEGWTDSNLLLTQLQVDDLKRLADSAAKLPSQGAATVYDALNMHAEPSRQSPSFFQIPEGGSIEMIGHRVAPRTAPPVPAAAPAIRRTTPTKKSKGKDAKRPPFALPPPQPPRPPSNWQQLSRPRVSDISGNSTPGTKAAPLDDWALVRTKDGKAGWVLSRMLNVSIPDEVAQYAEGHRITAYVPLADVNDKDKGAVMHNWLWTTAPSGAMPYEFDSFRVFVWNIRKHRYETAYIERNVKGYYPVETVNLPGQTEKAFTLVMEDKDGQIYKRTYGFNGYHVRMISKTPYNPPPALPDVRSIRSFDPTPIAAPAEITWMEKLRDWRKRWIGR